MVPFEYHVHKEIAAKLAAINAQLKAFAEGSGKTPDITFSIDATGVGKGVAEIIESKMPLAEIYRVYITGGINARVDFDAKQIRLPKAQLVSTLLACFDSDRIYLSKLSKELAAVLDELQNFEIKISDEGRDSYGAKIGAHHDIIVSLGLAAWTAERSGAHIKMW